MRTVKTIGAIVAAALPFLFPAAAALAGPDGTEPSQEQEPSSEQQPPGMPSPPRNNGNNSPASGGPRLSGTYNSTATYRTATQSVVLHFSSPCGGCNAQGPTGGAMNWTGAGWEGTLPGACGPIVNVVVPTSVVNGYAQTLTSTTTGLCGMEGPGVASLTRIGD